MKPPPNWKPERLEYVNFRYDIYSKDWVPAQVLEMTAHTVKFIMFNSRTVEIWARFGIEKHIKPSKHQRKVKRIVFVNQSES